MKLRHTAAALVPTLAILLSSMDVGQAVGNFVSRDQTGRSLTDGMSLSEVAAGGPPALGDIQSNR